MRDISKLLKKLTPKQKVRLMMEYRLHKMTEQKPLISDNDYEILDKSIITSEEVRTYNQYNRVTFKLLTSFATLEAYISQLEKINN